MWLAGFVVALGLIVLALVACYFFRKQCKGDVRRIDRKRLSPRVKVLGSKRLGSSVKILGNKRLDTDDFHEELVDVTHAHNNIVANLYV